MFCPSLGLGCGHLCLPCHYMEGWDRVLGPGRELRSTWGWWVGLGAPVGGSQPQALRVGEEAVAEGLVLSEAACLSSNCCAQPSWLPVASRL